MVWAFMYSCYCITYLLICKAASGDILLFLANFLQAGSIFFGREGFFEVLISFRNLHCFMKSNTLTTYLRESYEEFKRVTWPTRNQAIRLSGIVLSFVLASAIIIAALDYAFNMGYQYLLNLR